MTIPNHPFDPDTIFSNLEKAAEEREQKEYQAILLDKMEKTLLAELVMKIKATGDKMSMAEAETRARVSPEYKDHLAGLAAAKSAYHRADAKYNNLKALGDYRRSQEASKRVLGA